MPILTGSAARANLGRMLLGTTSPQAFISMMRSNYRRKGRTISLKIWADRLGYKSTRSLGMLIEGKRLPSKEMIELLAKDYGLSEPEKRYFHLLVLERGNPSAKLLAEIKQEIVSIRMAANKNIRRLTIGELDLVHQWYVFVIRQLVGTKDFVEDVDWIRRRLRGKVSSTEIKLAIQTLLEIGGLQRNPETGVLEKTDTNYFSKDDLPSEMIRKHHSQMLERTSEAIREQGVYERELISYLFSFRKSDLARLKQVLRDFRSTVDTQFATSDGDGVFQLNLHLFEHTLDLNSQGGVDEKL
jgi:uncharacterized protein (TIGR02147 family)